MPDAEDCWTAFLARDRRQDGSFVGAVLTTGIYCKPSCPARHPKRENMIFLPDGAAARAAGFRACLRCRPDEVGRDQQAVEAAIRLIRAPKCRFGWRQWPTMSVMRRIISIACSSGSPA
ncbi:Ada metal-binding domain-containing protein [Sphingobium scionense]